MSPIGRSLEVWLCSDTLMSGKIVIRALDGHSFCCARVGLMVGFDGRYGHLSVPLAIIHDLLVLTKWQ
jgi:hypothetical protein